jgi:hypothetical protein
MRGVVAFTARGADAAAFAVATKWFTSKTEIAGKAFRALARGPQMPGQI